MGRMVDAMERSSLAPEINPSGPSAAVGLPWAIHSALKISFGKEFATVAEIRLWWNKEENRKKFLDDRTK